MDVIDHTGSLAEGREQFEVALLALAGLFVLALAGVFWWFGATPGARAMILPLIAVAVLFFGAAGFTVDFFSNERADRYAQAIHAETLRSP